ncbi:hypothetical protein [Cloacibacterium sp.]|uniref:hypothetical protein n=1 Tax=Cloacibacterium sp. TaxID=1913682 RepID=UPI0039E4D006
MIRKLKYKEIDFAKYQECIKNSEQRKYSAEKHFLDVVAGENWDVLVFGDYEAVMPIPYVKKIGIKYVVNPFLTQQLGIFSKKDDVHLNEKFLEFLNENYIVKYYTFNDTNSFKTFLKTRKNFLLEPDSYEIVRQRYSPKRKRKLRLNPGVIEFSAMRNDLKFEEVESFISENMIGIKKLKNKIFVLNNLKDFYHQNLIQFYGFFFKGELTNLIAIYQETYSSVLLGTYNIRELVKQNGASNLIDFAIQENVETKIFDFEGGDLTNMDEYFRGFRAEMKPYPIIQNSKKELVKKIFF